MAIASSISLCVETFNDEAGYVAWIENEKFKGLVVQADSLERVIQELFTSLKVKIAFDYGISIGGVEEKINQVIQQFKRQKKCDERTDIQLNIA